MPGHGPIRTTLNAGQVSTDQMIERCPRRWSSARRVPVRRVTYGDSRSFTEPGEGEPVCRPGRTPGTPRCWSCWRQRRGKDEVAERIHQTGDHGHGYQQRWQRAVLAAAAGNDHLADLRGTAAARATTLAGESLVRRLAEALASAYTASPIASTAVTRCGREPVRLCSAARITWSSTLTW